MENINMLTLFEGSHFYIKQIKYKKHFESTKVIGWEKEIEKIKASWSKGSDMVILHGEEGLGKTTIMNKIIDDFANDPNNNGKFIVYLDCKEGFNKAIMSLGMALGFEAKNDLDLYHKTTHYLRGLEKQIAFFGVDNFDERKEDNSKFEVIKEYENPNNKNRPSWVINSICCNFLINTNDSDYYKTFKLEKLDDDSAIKLFYSTYYPKIKLIKSEFAADKIRKLVNALDNNPLLIKIVAQAFKQTKKSLDSSLDDLINYGICKVFPLNLKLEGDFENKTIAEVIYDKYNIDKLPEEDRISLFAFLDYYRQNNINDNRYIPYSDVKEIEKEHFFYNLVENSWVRRNEYDYSIPRIVREAFTVYLYNRKVDDKNWARELLLEEISEKNLISERYGRVVSCYSGSIGIEYEDDRFGDAHQTYIPLYSYKDDGVPIHKNQRVVIYKYDIQGRSVPAFCLFDSPSIKKKERIADEKAKQSEINRVTYQNDKTIIKLSQKEANLLEKELINVINELLQNKSSSFANINIQTINKLYFAISGKSHNHFASSLLNKINDETASKVLSDNTSPYINVAIKESKIPLEITVGDKSPVLFNYVEKEDLINVLLKLLNKYEKEDDINNKSNYDKKLAVNKIFAALYGINWPFISLEEGIQHVDNRKPEVELLLEKSQNQLKSFYETLREKGYPIVSFVEELNKVTENGFFNKKFSSQFCINKQSSNYFVTITGEITDNDNFKITVMYNSFEDSAQKYLISTDQVDYIFQRGKNDFEVLFYPKYLKESYLAYYHRPEYKAYLYDEETKKTFIASKEYVESPRHYSFEQEEYSLVDKTMIKGIFPTASPVLGYALINNKNYFCTKPHLEEKIHFGRSGFIYEIKAVFNFNGDVNEPDDSYITIKISQEGCYRVDLSTPEKKYQNYPVTELFSIISNNKPLLANKAFLEKIEYLRQNGYLQPAELKNSNGISF